MKKEHKIQELRTRDEALQEIKTRPELYKEYCQWPEQFRNEFLEFMMGVRGVKMTYDPFFKHIFNPEVYPERLSELLSLIGKCGDSKNRISISRATCNMLFLRYGHAAI